jgi:hypothetical protein
MVRIGSQDTRGIRRYSIMRKGVLFTFYCLLMIASPHGISAQTPSPTAGVLPPNTCVVCEVRDVSKKITTAYRTARGSIVDRVTTIAGESKTYLYMTYQECLHENTHGAQVVSNERPENSSMRTTQTYELNSKVVSAVYSRYCEAFGPFPRSMWQRCRCFATNTIESIGASTITSPRSELPLTEQLYTVTNCSHLDTERTISEHSRLGSIASAQFRNQYGVEPRDSFYRERRVVSCERK